MLNPIARYLSITPRPHCKVIPQVLLHASEEEMEQFEDDAAADDEREKTCERH